MTKQQLLAEIESLVEVPPGSIKGNEPLRDLEGGGWNSLTVISFIAMVDEKLGASLSAAELASCKSVADLVGLVQKHLKP